MAKRYFISDAVCLTCTDIVIVLFRPAWKTNRMYLCDILFDCICALVYFCTIMLKRKLEGETRVNNVIDVLRNAARARENKSMREKERERERERDRNSLT